MGKRGQVTVEGALVRRYVRMPARKLSAGQARRLIEAREKQRRALEMKKGEATYEEIAQALGYADPSGARKAVRAAIDRIGIEEAKDVVAMDLMRLAEYQKLLTIQLRTKGDLSVIPTLMQVMRERRVLVGWSPETWEEEQRKGKGITNNGVMVIQGSSSSDFVKGMMEAVGIDPNSEEAKKRLALVRSQEKKEQTGEFAISGPNPNQVLMERMASSALNENTGALEGSITLGRELEEKSIEDDTQ